MSFGLYAFALLGIERIVYGWIFHFPDTFKALCKGPLKSQLDYAGGQFWLVAKHIGVMIKVFQFSVIGYDLFFRCSIGVPPAGRLCVALTLASVGQLFNLAVFRALGMVGVYFGIQLGYKVPWVTGFPYNLGISDPQYWGTVVSIWGFYLLVLANGNVLGESYLVPWIETFWYVTSMQLLEHQSHGKILLKKLGVAVQSKTK